MACNVCGTNNPAQARFCMGCGGLLVSGQVCPQCYTLLPPEARYCWHCGGFMPVPLGAEARTAPPVVIPQPQRPPAPTQSEPGPTGVLPAGALPAAPAAAQAPAAPPPTPAPTAAPEEALKLELPELRPILRHFLPDTLYEPFERRPRPEHLTAALEHLRALLDTAQTYLPGPVLAAPQPGGVPAGGMVQGVFLFGDVSGFTPLSEQLKRQGQRGAERIMEIINTLFTELVQALFEHGGSLLKFGGDALLGVFPAENEAEMRIAARRAAQAGLAFQRVLAQEKFAAIQAGDEVRTLKIKCGISAGPYFAAHIGTAKIMAYVTTGHTVNQAEQAEGHAEPGHVVLTQAAFDLAQSDELSFGPVTKEPDPDFHRLLEAPLLADTVHLAGIRYQVPDGPPLAQIAAVAARLERLTPYLSRELVGRIVSNPSDARIAPDHRPVTVMFANYEGISELIADLGQTQPDLIVQRLNAYFVAMSAIVERYEGTLARMDQYAVGDRLVIFFGAPRAHEDDPMRAVYTALEMQQVVRKDFAALPISSAVYRFRQRIGINTGHLFAGNAGAPGLRQEYTLMGDDINMAARLMSKAGWQEIYISDKTHERVQTLFALEDMGELKVKGKEITIHTHKVLGKRGEYNQVRGLESECPLLGREQELAAVQTCLTALQSGRGQVLVVTGESGLGKTRLLREARAWMDKTPEGAQVQWVTARALSFSEGISYWVIADVFQSLLALPPDSNDQDRLYRLWETAEDLLGKETAREVAPFLAGLMGIQVGEDWANIHSLEPRVLQKQTLWAVRQYIAALACRRPTIMILDDLHWADEASLAVFDDLLQAADTCPIMFVLIMRPLRQKGAWRLHDRAERDFHHRYTEVSPLPLDATLTRRMVAELLPGAEFSPTTLDEIYAKSVGNPFYIEEIVRSLQDNGAVVEVKEDADYLGDLVATLRRKPVVAQKKRWRVDAEKIQAIGVPDTLHSALIARIDRLPEDARLALQMAAVIGRQFQTGLLRGLGQAQLEQLDLPLAQLERNNLIQSVGLNSQAYIFPDALVQEVAYDNLLMQRRQDFHTRIGLLLEEQLGDQADANCHLLAQHFANSSDTARARHYLLLAGRKAQAEFAISTALDDYARCMDLLDPTNHWAERAEVLHRRQQLYALTGRPNEREADLNALRAIIENHPSPLRTAQLHNAWADLYAATGRYAEAVQAAETALAVADDQAERAAALHTLGMVAYFQGNYAQARPRLEEAIALRQALPDPGGVLWSEMYISMMYFMQGDFQLAMEHNRQAIELSEQRMDWFQLGIHQTNGGRIALRLGQFEQAKHLLHASLEMKTRLGDRPGLGFSHYALGLAALYLGDSEAAETAINQSLDLRRGINDQRGVAQSLQGLGRVALARGKHSRALRSLNEAADLHRSLKLFNELAGDCSLIAQAHLDGHDLPAAQTADGEAMTLLAQFPNLEAVQEVWLTHYRVLCALKDPGAPAAIAQAQAIVHSQAERLSDPDLHISFLERVRVNCEILSCPSTC